MNKLVERSKNHYERGRRVADVLCEMQGYVRAAAEPRPAGDSVKAAISRAARETGLSVRRVTTLWYRYPCQVLAEELVQLRTWHDGWLERRMARLAQELAALQAMQAELHDRARP